MSTKDYAIAAHLINSRLQLIKRMVEWDERSTPERLFNCNYELFQRVVVSIARKHNIICTGSDMLYGAHLFLISVGVVPERMCYLVMHMPGKLGKPVTTPDEGITILPADPKERLTHEEALRRLNQPTAKHGIPFFWINTRHYYDEFHV